MMMRLTRKLRKIKLLSSREQHIKHLRGNIIRGKKTTDKRGIDKMSRSNLIQITMKKNSITPRKLLRKLCIQRKTNHLRGKNLNKRQSFIKKRLLNTQL